MFAAALLAAFAALFATPAPAQAQNATGRPVIWGHTVEGERLSVGLNGISDPNGGPFTNINILWYAVNSANVETFIGERAGTYGVGHWHELVQADVGQRIKVKVNFKDAAGNREHVESTLTGVVTDKPILEIDSHTFDEPAAGRSTEHVEFRLLRASHRNIQFNVRLVAHPSAAAPGRVGDTGDASATYPNVVVFAPGQTYATWPIRIHGLDADTSGDSPTEQLLVEAYNYQDRWVEIGTGSADGLITIINHPPVPATGGGVAPTGTFARLPFTEDLYIGGSRISGDLPASVKNAFTVTADGSDLEITRVARTGNDALNIYFPSGVTIFVDQTVTVSYDRDTAGANALEDVLGNQVQSFTNHGISNGSSVSPATAADPLGVRLRNAPRQHDGATPFTFQLNFTDDVTISVEEMRDHAINVTGGTVTDAAMVDGRADKWTITVEPSGTDDVTISVPPSSSCSDAGALCTADRIALGTGAFANLPYVAAVVRQTAVSVSDASVTEGPNAKLRFEITLDRASSDTVTVEASTSDGTATAGSDYRAKTLTKTFAPGETSKIAVVSVLDDSLDEEDETFTLTLSSPTNATLDAATATGTITDDDDDAPLPALSVADAAVEEGPNAKLRFEITLDRAASGTVTVEASTSDGTATAGSDYRAKTLSKTFAPGETSKIAVVSVLDDAHNEGAETLTLTLSNPSGAQVADGEAIGTIENHDPLPRALMARFGRTAAVHVVEHVEERIEAPRQPGFRGRFAGRELRPGMERELALSFLSHLGGSTGVSGHGVGVHDPMGMPGVGAGPSGPSVLGGGRLGMAAAAGSMGGMSGLGGPTGTAVGPRAGPLAGGPSLMGLGGGNLLTGSALSLNRETRQGGILSFWSRGARSHFSGRDEALSLGGDVQTTMFGADYAKGPLVAGLSLSHSRGLGEYAGVAGGQVASAVTGLYPWLGYKATDRITVWGVAGYGAGGMLLTPDGGPVLESGLSMAMAAAGTRGELVAGGASGFELAFKADALWVGTSSDGVDGPAGRLKATEAAVTRFRTGLEGSRDYTLAGRLSLRPSVEVGLRQDGGDAETGAGMDVGGGLVVSDAGTGLSVDLRVRMLVVHQAEGFRERGMAVSLSYNPTPSTPLGFMARVAPSWGGQAQSGAEALWGRETMTGMAHGGLAQGDRLDGEVGYGLPVGSRLVGTPRVGFSTSEYGREYRVGYGLGLLDRGRMNFELGVDAQRRESPMLNGAANGFLGRATLGW